MWVVVRGRGVEFAYGGGVEEADEEGVGEEADASEDGFVFVEVCDVAVFGFDGVVEGWDVEEGVEEGSGGCAFAKEVVEGGSGGAVVECGAFEECGAGLLEGELAADVAGGGGRVDFGWGGGVFVVHVSASGLGAVGFFAWDGLGFAGVGVWWGGWWGGGACEGALCGVWLFGLFGGVEDVGWCGFEEAAFVVF